MIYVECNADIALVISLTNISRRGIIHEFKGKDEICKRLRNVRESKGLIDEDPSGPQPPYVRESTPQGDFARQDIRLLRHSSSGNYLIVLCPRLEEWILKTAKVSRVDVRKYGFPSDAARFRRTLNIRLGNFEKLLDDLKDKSNRLKTLKRLLEGAEGFLFLPRQTRRV